MTRDIPFRERKPKKRIEADSEKRNTLAASFPAPKGELAFQEGWRECVELYALHAPNKRSVGKILDNACVLLEEACLRSPTRDAYARYEGYKAAMKELRRQKRIC